MSGRGVFLLGLSLTLGSILAMYIMLPEPLRPWFLLGLGLLAAGFLAAAWHRQDVDAKKAQLEAGPRLRATTRASRREPSRRPKFEFEIVRQEDGVGSGRSIAR
jgi:hypothetical protein